MLPDEVPPEWMWTHPDALGEHFDEVRAKRGHSPDGDDEPPMTKNEDPRLLALRRR